MTTLWCMTSSILQIIGQKQTSNWQLKTPKWTGTPHKNSNSGLLKNKTPTNKNQLKNLKTMDLTTLTRFKICQAKEIWLKSKWMKVVTDTEHPQRKRRRKRRREQKTQIILCSSTSTSNNNLLKKRRDLDNNRNLRRPNSQFESWIENRLKLKEKNKCSFNKKEKRRKKGKEKKKEEGKRGKRWRRKNSNKKSLRKMKRMVTLKMPQSITNQVLYLKHPLNHLKKMPMMHLFLSYSIPTWPSKIKLSFIWDLCQLWLDKFNARLKEAKVVLTEFGQSTHYHFLKETE